MKRVWYLFMFCLFFVPGSHAATYIVGNGIAPCTHDNLDDAIAAAQANLGADVIKLVNDQAYLGDTFNVLNQDLTIVGGYNSCQEAGSAIFFPSGKTTLDASGHAFIDSVFHISEDQGVQRTITLENLIITGGSSLQGGGLLLDGDVEVNLINTDIRENAAVSGAGIYMDISEGAKLTVESGQILLNTASGNGGGIYCAWTGMNPMPPLQTKSVTLLQGSIEMNGAQEGGGVYLEECIMETYSGMTAGGISQNQASLSGGAAAIYDGSLRAYGMGDPFNIHSGLPQEPAYFSGNNGTFFGGAFFLSRNASLTLQDAQVLSNMAEKGGAVFADEGSTVTIKRSPTLHCPGHQICSQTSGNGSAAQASQGGAFYIQGGSSLNLEETLVNLNRSTAGSAMVAHDQDTVVSVRNTKFTGNSSATEVVLAYNNADLYFVHSSFGHNDDQTADIRASGITFNMIWSLLFEDQGDAFDLSNLNNANPFICSGMHTRNGIPALDQETWTLAATPYLDALLQLNPLGGGSDACIYDPAYAVGSGRDFDWDRRYLYNGDVQSDQDHTVDPGADAVPDPVITVGADLSCDFERIQGALDQAQWRSQFAVGQISELRIAANMTYPKNQELTLDNADANVIGGYTHCNDALAGSSPTAGQIILNGSLTEGGNSPVLSIDSTEVRNVYLSNLRFTDGAAGLAIEGQAHVNASGVRIDHNQGILGGGIALDATEGALLVLSNSNVDFNNADALGGGIYCHAHNSFQNPNYALTLDNTDIDHNSAGSGGGLFLTDCSVYLRSDVHIDHNLADTGGGVFLMNDQGLAEFSATAAQSSGNRISDNSAAIAGGGLYLDNQNGFNDLFGLEVSRNQADLGGGVMVQDGNLTLSPLFQADSTYLLSKLVDNQARLGAAIYNQTSNQVYIGKTEIHGNVSSSDGDVLYQRRGSAIVSSSLIHHNGDGASDYAFVNESDGSGGSSLVISHSTLADNAQQIALLRNAGDSIMQVENSILWEEGDLYSSEAGQSNLLEAQCNIVTETLSFPALNAISEDPLFASPETGDYHLSGQSPAVDLCPEPVWWNVRRDVDFDEFGTDNLNFIDIQGTYDAGYDEANGLDGSPSPAQDIIFKNSMEGVRVNIL